MLPDPDILKTGWLCLCPKCQNASIYKDGLNVSLKDVCPSCGLDFQKNDSADGPAVFLTFILGFAIVPLALVFEFWLSPALWVHAVLWGAVLLGLTLGTLRPIKAYIIALQYKHRPEDWD